MGSAASAESAAVATQEEVAAVPSSCWTSARDWWCGAAGTRHDGRKRAADEVDGAAVALLASHAVTEHAAETYLQVVRRCLRERRLFHDECFPASAQSLQGEGDDAALVSWTRPHELSEEPRLFVEGASRFDVQQGELGDCWMLSSLANLTLQPSLFHRVVPRDQSFSYKYTGAFHFWFWRFGSWKEVVVDDRLPSRDGSLLFLHSASHSEFWSALLEKAYAKLFGSYAALDGGQAVDAMVDFTGGVGEMVDLANPPPNLFLLMRKAFLRSSLMACSFHADNQAPAPNTINQQLWDLDGLVPGHAYSVTGVKEVTVNTSRGSLWLSLLRLRNPWGNMVEWKGPWSDGSEEWESVTDAEKRRLGLTFDADGEFWMTFEDFMRHFELLQMCHLVPDEDDGRETLSHGWAVKTFRSSWETGLTAGGCRNNEGTFWKNPQFRFTVEEPDEGPSESCSLLLALQQEDRRGNLGSPLTIGFSVFHLKEPDKLPRPVDRAYFTCNAPMVSTPFINLREVSLRCHLLPGTYLVVPSTFNPNEDAEFLLRIVSERTLI